MQILSVLAVSATLLSSANTFPFLGGFEIVRKSAEPKNVFTVPDFSTLKQREAEAKNKFDISILGRREADAKNKVDIGTFGSIVERRAESVKGDAKAKSTASSATSVAAKASSTEKGTPTKVTGAVSTTDVDPHFDLAAASSAEVAAAVRPIPPSLCSDKDSLFRTS